MPGESPILELKSVGKQFPGVTALAEIDLSVSAGEVLAIVGENGAGKSTLLKILGGCLPPDRGEIHVDGRPCALSSVRHAQQLGIGLIHQELNLAPDLSVAENVFLGNQPFRGPSWLRFTNRRELHLRTKSVFDLFGISLSPELPVSRLSISQKQLVEIARALALRARLLILDEPTSSLAETESIQLLQLIEKLRSQGVAIIYVSHRLEEVERIADRVLVLRDGRHVGTVERHEVSRDKLITLMIGRSLTQLFPERHPANRSGIPALEVRSAGSPATYEVDRLQVFPGEIVGLAGLIGAGRSELAKVIFGLEGRGDWEIYLDGQPLPSQSPGGMIQAGIAFVPEDRKLLGLFLQHSVQTNLAIVAMQWMSRWGWRNREREVGLAQQLVQELDIRTSHLSKSVMQLSGGNQQKVLLGKWLANRPRVLILDEPTRGVDIRAKQDIYRTIHGLAESGVAILLISSELEELQGLAHRIVVMKSSRIVGSLENDGLDQATIMRLAIGNTPLN